jgi:hypothetical protein
MPAGTTGETAGEVPARPGRAAGVELSRPIARPAQRSTPRDVRPSEAAPARSPAPGSPAPRPALLRRIVDAVRRPAAPLSEPTPPAAPVAHVTAAAAVHRPGLAIARRQLGSAAPTARERPAGEGSQSLRPAPAVPPAPAQLPVGFPTASWPSPEQARPQATIAAPPRPPAPTATARSATPAAPASPARTLARSALSRQGSAVLARQSETGGGAGGGGSGGGGSGGGGSGGDGGGGHDADLIYTELLGRVRQEQEQLGHLIDHPF